MVVMYKMTPEKKEKWAKKLEKMISHLEELKSCFDESGDYDEEEWDDEEPQYKAFMRKAMKSAMKGRYSKKNFED